MPFLGLIKDSNAPARIPADDPRLKNHTGIMLEFRARWLAMPHATDKMVRAFRAVGSGNKVFVEAQEQSKSYQRAMDAVTEGSPAWVQHAESKRKVDEYCMNCEPWLGQEVGKIACDKASVRAVLDTLAEMKSFAGELVSGIDGELNAVLRRRGMPEMQTEATAPLIAFIARHVEPAVAGFENLRANPKAITHEPEGICRLIYCASWQNAKLVGE